MLWAALGWAFRPAEGGRRLVPFLSFIFPLLLVFFLTFLFPTPAETLPTSSAPAAFATAQGATCRPPRGFATRWVTPVGVSATQRPVKPAQAPPRRSQRRPGCSDPRQVPSQVTKVLALIRVLCLPSPAPRAAQPGMPARSQLSGRRGHPPGHCTHLTDWETAASPRSRST